MKVRIIKVRLVILILSLIAIISIMSISIKNEADKIDNVSESYKEKLIRFHVIANSDTEEDQELKLKVRDEIISYLQPKLENSSSIEESEKIITSEYDNLQSISRETILDNGYEY
ncbi:MAG: stage II sporulation protein R, partial [Peptostreptococcaceae bacterium]|nr:stage II sporulation protein R [Peptostreptococcaceae bacterium]